MRTLLIFAFSFCSVTAVFGQSAFMAENAFFPDDTAPNTVHWELRTAANQAVSWEYTFPTVNSFLPWSDSKTVFADTAASLGVDWAAWSAAVLNPDFNRWIVTRNGVTIEKPWTRTVLGTGPFLGLDELRFVLNKNTLQGHGDLRISASAFDNPVVPEPSSWLLLVWGSLVLHGRFRVPDNSGRH